MLNRKKHVNFIVNLKIMWALLLSILGYGGTAAAGWMISDWFNEKQTTKQVEASGGSGFSVMEFITKNWVKWLVTLVGVGLIGFFVAKLLKNLKK